MGVVYFICCILRPICLPVPEALLILWGNRYMNPNTAFVVGLAGSLLGIGVMYLIAEWASNWIIRKLKCEKSLHKVQEYIKSYKIKIIGILFIIPVFPDMIICFSTSLMKIKLSWFLIIAIISKTVSIGMIEYSQQLAQFFSVEKWQIIFIELFIINIISCLFKLHELRKKGEITEC